MLCQPRKPQRIGLTRVLRLVKVISIWVVDIYAQVTVVNANGDLGHV